MTKHIAVLGASSGIGRELALQSAKDSVHIHLIARRAQLLQTLSEEISEKGGESTIHAIDLSQPEAFLKFHRNLQEKDIQIDTLFHSAAMLTLDAAEHVHPEDWAALLQTNLYSATDVLGILYPEMVKRGQGEIVLISSCLE